MSLVMGFITLIKSCEAGVVSLLDGGKEGGRAAYDAIVLRVPGL